MTISARTSYRLGLLVALGTALVLVYGTGALGIIGAGGRADLLYAASLAVLVVGAVVARFRAPGMARALVAAAGAIVVATVVALVFVVPGRDDVSLVDLLGLTVMFAGGFAVAAALFRRSARQRASQ
jgi:hypothetical protein